MGLCVSEERGDNDYVKIDSYDGEKWLCFRHGEGTYHYMNGDIYKGDWRWDKKHGYGVYTHSKGEVKQGYFYQDEYIGQTPGNLFAETSCFTGCFGASTAEPLASDEPTGNQEQRDYKREQLQQRAKVREEREKRRDAMADKYRLPKKTRNIQEPKK